MPWAQMEWPAGVAVADLGYGSLHVTQDLADGHYDRVVLLAAMVRGRPPGRIYRSTWDGVLPDPAEIQARVFEAGAGVVDLDHLLIIAQYVGGLPPDVVIVELEPVDVGGGEGLSPEAAARLPEVIELARREALAPPRYGAPTG